MINFPSGFIIPSVNDNVIELGDVSLLTKINNGMTPNAPWPHTLPTEWILIWVAAGVFTVPVRWRTTGAAIKLTAWSKAAVRFREKHKSQIL